MKLPISNKVGNYGKKPHIKKGFYPAKFMGYKATKSDGTEIEGKHGKMIILEMAIFKPTEAGIPTEPMTLKEEKLTSDVVLDKFVYITYKNKAGEHQSSITPNSKPTKIFKALGWEPDFEGEADVNLDKLIGGWVEVLIDDYELKDKDEQKYTCSSIGDVNPYEGETPSKEADKKAEEASEKAKPKSVAKEVKHEDVKEDNLSPEIKEKVTQLRKLKEDGHLTEEGFNQAMEQLGVDSK